MPLDWLSWEFWSKDTQGLNHLAVIIAGVIGIPLLAIRTFAANRSANAALEQAKTAAERHDEQTRADRERRITESFAKAVEQLGSDKLETRLGAIYTFERIARESEREYWPIMETLTAFVRERAPWPPPPPPSERPTSVVQQPRPRGIAPETIDEKHITCVRVEETQDSQPPPATDIQAVLSVLGRRNETAPKQYREERAAERRLDLTKTDLRGANLRGAHLEEANLRGAQLAGAHLWGAHLTGADLQRAHLEGAGLQEANLEGAFLVGVNLKGADLQRAHLEGAFLLGFAGPHLGGAVIWEARLEGATGLTQEQVNSAYGNEKTMLPDGLKRPAHWPAAAPHTPDNPWWPA